MKKTIIAFIALGLAAFNSHAQNVHLGNTALSNGWFRLGTLQLAQQGADAYIQIVAGGGYNATHFQNGECHIHFRTSNGSSENNGFYGSGNFYNTGRSKIIAGIKIVQLDLSHWELYALMPHFTGNGSLLSLRSVSGIWQESFSKMEPPSNRVAIDLVEELLISSDTYYTGKIGIGTTTPDEKLAVNGKIHAKEVKVDLYGRPGTAQTTMENPFHRPGETF